MMGETLVSDGRNVNPKRAITPPRERVFGRLGRSTSYATDVAPRQLATDRGRGHPDVTGVTVRHRTCTVEGCGRPHSARGYCATHHRRVLRNGTADPDRPVQTRNPRADFWGLVDVGHPLGCWTWTGAVALSGYGNWYPGARVSEFAHRRAYELLMGPIPAGRELDHLCRNRLCCNPDHLEPVTPAENIARSGAHISAVRARIGKNPPRQTYVHEGDATHGVYTTYSNHRCRCEPCREAWNAYCTGARRRRLSRQEVAS